MPGALGEDWEGGDETVECIWEMWATREPPDRCMKCLTLRFGEIDGDVE